MPKAYEQESTYANPFAGKRLAYLIGAEVFPASSRVRPPFIVETSYDTNVGGHIAYCNLFDEKNSGKYAPYLHSSDTAAQYQEGQIDPKGEGFLRNLKDQLDRRQAWGGFTCVELDNPDAYDTKDVLNAYNYAMMRGFSIIAKNPGICQPDPVGMVAHSSVVGIIVEKDCGDPKGMDLLRRKAGKPILPVWFVCFGSGKRWGASIAGDCKLFVNMYATYSSQGEYGNAIDL
jgi:hypothetical protein